MEMVRYLIAEPQSQKRANSVASKRIIEGKECKKCGHNLYYKNKALCVTCYMTMKNKQKELGAGWPKRVNFQKAMQGVRYD